MQFFVLFQLLETSQAGQTETFQSVNGSKSTRLTSRFKALGFESHRLRKQSILVWNLSLANMEQWIGFAALVSELSDRTLFVHGSCKASNCAC